ncbi:hypothetical protein ACRN9N_20345 [Shewanella baltica]|uniref:hypothetical protein n=1 Tax=Shewanella baltica TaxID=62322 RepID=UPI003D7B26C9
MSQWLQSAKATVSAGAAVISFTDNKDFASVRAGDVVMINGQIWQCSSGTRPDSTGKSTVTLAAPWPYTGASNVNAFVFRTTHDLLQLTSDARKLTNITKALLAAQEDILKGTTPTINVPIGLDPATGDEEVIAVTPWQYVINVVNASLGNISAIGAMSQVQFEATREQNKEEFAASGFVHFGRHENESSQVTIVNQGLNTYLEIAAYTNTIGLGRGVNSNPLLLSGKSKTMLPILHVAGCIYTLECLGTASTAFEAARVKFPQAPDGKTTYNKSTGVITNHTTVTAAFNAQAVDPTNVEVVTDRVDMWGFEAWLEEVSTTNPYVYPNGLIQSQATTMDGIATSASTRPVTYYAVFDGDTGSKGKGLNYFTISDANKKKVLANPKNNLYFLDDGRLVQWRLRQRTIAGAGNGDWAQVDSTIKNVLRFDSNNLIKSQGTLNASLPANPSWSTNTLFGTGTADFGSSEAGVFASKYGDTSSSVSGECYFLVCGTANRLNQGAYHPSFNPRGARRWNTIITSDSLWYGGNTLLGNSIIYCFNTVNAGVDTTTKAASLYSGYIGAQSGRPDGRYYDAIYADGDGGVCRDMRYSAYGKTLEDFAEADREVKNGTYRGFEKQVFSKATQGTSGGENDVFGLFYNDDLPSNGTFAISQLSGVKSVPSIGDIHHIYEKSTGLILSGVVTSTSYTVINCRRLGGDVAIRSYPQQSSANFIWISSISQSLSVGGSFLQTDVIGNPVNILATPALANGWQGGWIDHSVYPAFLSRKAISVPNSIVLFGTTWLSVTNAFDSSKNTVHNHVSGDGALIAMHTYQAFAKQTEPAANAAVYGGNVGTGKVSATSWNAVGNGMVLLAESCAGIILKSNNGYPDIDMGVAVTKSHIIVGGVFGRDQNQIPEHHPIYMQAPSNNSPAFKALDYNVNINQQAFIQYAYTELKHNGTSWGDDGKVTIVNNQSTKTDLNGNTVLVGTAKLKEPIGWIKNKV